jgi:hypothetical protein
VGKNKNNVWRLKWLVALALQPPALNALNETFVSQV